MRSRRFEDSQDETLSRNFLFGQFLGKIDPQTNFLKASTSVYSSLRESASFKPSFVEMCHTVQIIVALTVLAGIFPCQVVFDNFWGK